MPEHCSANVQRPHSRFARQQDVERTRGQLDQVSSCLHVIRNSRVTRSPENPGMTNESLSRLDDAALASELLRLSCRERDATVQLILHLAEFDARRLYLGAGFPSLFAYCREVLRLSEGESYSRIEAARASRAFPVIAGLLTDGTINLTTVRLLAPHLTPGDGTALLEEAKGRSKREVEELLARRFPRPDVATTIRRDVVQGTRMAAREAAGHHPTTDRGVPAAPAPIGVLEHRGPTAWSASAQPAIADQDPGGRMESSDARSTGPASRLLARPPAVAGEGAGSRADEVAPLSPGRYLIRFTGTSQMREKLRRAQELLAHCVPTGDLGEILERSLDVLLDKLLQARGVKRANRRGEPLVPLAVRAPGRGSSRHIPTIVRRTVWLRDGGRCAFVSSAGRRCAAKAPLEFHHRKPYGIGGAATVENIELRCRPHNAYEAMLFYGPPRAVDPNVSVSCSTRSGAS